MPPLPHALNLSICLCAAAAGAAHAQVFQPLGYPAGLNSSIAIAISADGTVVAGESSREYILHGQNVGMPVGYRWTAGSGWVVSACR